MHKIHVLTKIYENKIENEIKNSSFFVCMFSTFPANSNKKPKQKNSQRNRYCCMGPTKDRVYGSGLDATVTGLTRCECAGEIFLTIILKDSLDTDDEAFGTSKGSNLFFCQSPNINAINLHI